jgi:hypothetical protein
MVAGLLIACAPSAPAIPVIVIKAHDFLFEGLSKLEAGLVTFRLTNDGQEPHHAQLARLNDGVTMEQLQQALQESEQAAFALVTLAGGPGAIDPGQSTEVTVDLAPGQYVVLCFIPGADGVPHLAKGMIGAFEVSGTKSAAAEPKADQTITLKDFTFDMPAEFKAGVHTWHMVNDGPQPHEIALIRLAEGKTLEDAGAWFAAPSGPPPYTLVGGFQAFMAGATGWLTIDLKPGDYVALCGIPDPASGKPHMELGMLMPFTAK